MDKQITYKPIGIIHSPFKSPQGTPIQPKGAKGIKGEVMVKEKYKEGLKDLEGFSHIILIYHFHLSKGYSLIIKPYVPDFDIREVKRIGWLKSVIHKLPTKKDDGRFLK